MILAPARRTGSLRFSAAPAEAPTQTVELPAPWATIPGGAIDGGEIILLAVKPSMWRPLLDSAPWMVTCAVLAVALVWLRRPLPALSLTTTAQLILWVALARLGASVVRWVPTWYVLTNHRIIHIQGVRSPQVNGCPLIDIHDTCVHRSGPEQLARLGTIVFATDDTAATPPPWRFVVQADEVEARIRRAMHSASGQRRLAT